MISGGNFHAEPVAFAADIIALAIAEIGAISERRMALLLDSGLSGLPPFLVRDGGVNSGFMIAQVTAAALASENKSLAHPASVDSLPTSANQEDHVSMATFAAPPPRRHGRTTPRWSSASRRWPPRRASNSKRGARRARRWSKPNSPPSASAGRLPRAGPLPRPDHRSHAQWARQSHVARRPAGHPARATPESTIQFRHRKDTSP